MNSHDLDTEFFEEPIVKEMIDVIGLPNTTSLSIVIGEIQHAMAVFSCFNENAQRRPLANLLEKYGYDEQNVADFKDEFAACPNTYGAKVHQYFMNRRYSRTR